MLVSATNPWLGPSSDGLVHDPMLGPPDGLAKFKDPYATRKMTLDEAVSKEKFLSLLWQHSGASTKRQRLLLSEALFHVRTSQITSGMTCGYDKSYHL